MRKRGKRAAIHTFLPMAFDLLGRKYGPVPLCLLALPSNYFPLAAAVFLALVHVHAHRLRFLNVIPRSRWLSAGAGISVAYVFLELLPGLNAHQRVLRAAAGDALSFIEHHAYLLALLGLATFYGLERSARQSRRRRARETGQDEAGPGLFWISIVAFAGYNAFIGYLLLDRAREGTLTLLLFTVAMALHFVVNDYGLRDHYKDLYARYGRWLLGLAVLAGGVSALFITIQPAAWSLPVAFLAGGITLNVLKEELPDERESRFAAFALGAGAYAVLLVAL